MNILVHILIEISAHFCLVYILEWNRRNVGFMYLGLVDTDKRFYKVVIFI